MSKIKILYISLFILILFSLFGAIFFKYEKPLIIGLTGIGEIKFVPKNTDKIVYGFLPYWSVTTYNQDFNKITDLAYFSLFLNESGKVNTSDQTYTIWKEGKVFNQILENSAKNGVRNHVTVSIHDNDSINNFLNCQSCYQTSLDSIRSEINSKKYIHGVNFDFEYVGEVEITTANKYSDYIKYMSAELKKEYGKNFMVVVSTFGDSFKKSRLTNILTLKNSGVDYFFVMSYDYFTPSNDTAGPVSPLIGAGKNYNYDVTSTITDYLKILDSKKIIMGIPLYGLNYIVESPTPYAKRIPGDDSIGYSIQQNLSEIFKLQNRERAEVLVDKVSSMPYFTYISDTGVNRIVFFENQQSLIEKIGLSTRLKLAGVGFWALGYEGGGTEFLQFLEKYFTQP